jgi:predicted RNase H-like nuclease (RuvC/YqgF family)
MLLEGKRSGGGGGGEVGMSLQALMESRVEMHEAQITKMQRALEEADQEKARLEEDLEVALTIGAMTSLGSADQEVPSSPPIPQAPASWK